MEKVIFVFLLISQSLFSQSNNSKKTTKELLQGTWIITNSRSNLKNEFNGDYYYFIKTISNRDTVFCKCNYELKGKTIDTHCPGKEKLIFIVKKITDSTLIMKQKNGDYYNYVKIKK